MQLFVSSIKNDIGLERVVRLVSRCAVPTTNVTKCRSSCCCAVVGFSLFIIPSISSVCKGSASGAKKPRYIILELYGYLQGPRALWTLEPPISLEYRMIHKGWRNQAVLTIRFEYRHCILQSQCSR